MARSAERPVVPASSLRTTFTPRYSRPRRVAGRHHATASVDSRPRRAKPPNRGAPGGWYRAVLLSLHSAAQIWFDGPSSTRQVHSPLR
jgi:hypothetical protein